MELFPRKKTPLKSLLKIPAGLLEGRKYVFDQDLFYEGKYQEEMYYCFLSVNVRMIMQTQTGVPLRPIPMEYLVLKSRNGRQEQRLCFRVKLALSGILSKLDYWPRPSLQITWLRFEHSDYF